MGASAEVRPERSCRGVASMPVELDGGRERIGWTLTTPYASFWGGAGRFANKRCPAAMQHGGGIWNRFFSMHGLALDISSLAETHELNTDYTKKLILSRRSKKLSCHPFSTRSR